MLNDTTVREKLELLDPARWGLPVAAAHTLGERVYRYWERFRSCFYTQTRDGSEHAYTYLRGQLTMERERNFAQIDRRVNGGDGQAVQHFVSNSPWSARAVLDQIQAELSVRPEVQSGSVLLLDESADEKAGTESAGASRQYNGRLGKVDLCRVDTCLAYANSDAGLWTLVDGELFLSEEWFSDEFEPRRYKVGLPTERLFQTKLELGLEMIGRAKANGLPFEWVGCDTFYGRDGGFRAALADAHLSYAADVPANTRVYLNRPEVGVPKKRHRQGRAPTRCQVLSRHRPCEVRALAADSTTQWQRAEVRHTERGLLRAEFAVKRVWTLTEKKQVRAEWLVIRREADGDCRYSLLNAPRDTLIQQLIDRSCQRYFVERTFQEAKTDLGWGEFQAQKYRAGEHHFALTALALWFIAETKLDWRQQYARDPELAREFDIERLPALSTANVCELLQAVLPLPQLTPEQAVETVVSHFVNRARSTRSRVKAQTISFDTS